MFRLYLEYARVISPDRDNGGMVSRQKNKSKLIVRTLCSRSTDHDRVDFVTNRNDIAPLPLTGGRVGRG